MPEYKSYYITTPELREFLFHALRTVPSWEKKNLNALELQYLKSEESIKRFVEGETLDKTLQLLVRCGYSFAVMIAPKDEQNLEVIMEGVATQYHVASARKAIVQSMQIRKIFVVGSREIMLTQHLMAQNSHSQMYTLDYIYQAMREKMHTLREKANEDLRESIKFADEAAKLALNASIAQQVILSLTGLTQYQMNALLAMFPHRNTMISHTRLAQLLQVSMRTQGTAKVCGELEKMGYVIREIGYRKNKKSQNYMISEKGIDAVMVYLKWIINKSL